MRSTTRGRLAAAMLAVALGCSESVGESVVSSVLDSLPADSAEAQTGPAGDQSPLALGACPDTIYVAEAGEMPQYNTVADGHVEVLGAQPTPRHVHLSWTGAPDTTATLLWRTDSQTLGSTVQFGLSPDFGTEVYGASFLVDGADSIPRVHEVRLCGLSPDTTYYYRVGVEGAFSPGYSFTTGPAPGNRSPTVFLASGDSRDSPGTWRKIMSAADANGAEFRIFTGDAVATGSNVEEWDEWFDAGTGFAESVPTIMGHGNHEYYAQAYFALHGMPGNERYFSFDYGNMHFVALDDEVYGDEAWQAQADWLAADLAATEQPWKFTFHHEPAFSSSLTHPINEYVKQWIVPVAEAGGVDFDFSGHNHHYERTLPIRADARDDAAGITYVITGGAGAGLYENDGSQWYSHRVVVDYHYVLVRVENRVLTLLVYDLAGNLIDTFVRQK